MVAAAPGALALVDWEIALEAAAKALKGGRAYVVANPSLPNEALFLLKKVISKTGGEGRYRVEQGAEAPLPGVADLALRADRAANVRGAELLGFTRSRPERSEGPLAGVKQGDVVVLADVEPGVESRALLARASAVIVVGTVMPRDITHITAILPIANFAEEDGTFTNLRGRAQRFLQAKQAPGLARPSWYVLADLLNAIGEKAEYFAASAVFDAMAAAETAFGGMSYDSLALRGAVVMGDGREKGEASQVGAGR